MNVVALEIERKFLVVQDVFRSYPRSLLQQGYLNRDTFRTVRVRVSDELAWLTVKGETVGASRLEFEYSIPVGEGRQLMKLCLETPIEKHRFVIPWGNHVWQVDEFLGENRGLILAEIELRSEDECFEKPQWIGREVTSEPRYYNSSLSVHPFQDWLLDEEGRDDS